MAWTSSQRSAPPVAVRRPANHVVIILTALLFLVGCGPPLPPESASDTPPAHLGREHALINNPTAEKLPDQHPNPPAIAASRESNLDNSSGATTHITPALHTRFVRGITMEEAQRLLAVTPAVVGGDDQNTTIYRWEDEQGAYFTARFEAGHLVMCSRLRQRPAPSEETKAPPPAVTMDDGSPAAQVAPGVYVPLERAITSSMAQPRGVEAPTLPLAIPRRTIPSETAKGRKASIAVAGATRRERQRESGGQPLSGRSYTPLAKLPDFGHSLHQGRYEIRFLNPTDTTLTVGLRQDKRGQDRIVAPKGRASIKVDRGTYELYFLREDDPNALYEAPPITIDGIQNTDVEVHLNSDDIQIRPIDYGVRE